MVDIYSVSKVLPFIFARSLSLAMITSSSKCAWKVLCFALSLTHLVARFVPHENVKLQPQVDCDCAMLVHAWSHFRGSTQLVCLVLLGQPVLQDDGLLSTRATFQSTFTLCAFSPTCFCCKACRFTIITTTTTRTRSTRWCAVAECT